MPTNINKLNHLTLKAICLKGARLCELVQKYLALVKYGKENTLVLWITVTSQTDENSDVL